MEDQNNSTPSTSSEPQAQVSAATPQTAQPVTTLAKVERVTAWVLIVTAVLFAVIGVTSIWGVFGDDDVVWRSLGSLAVVALAAVIINVGARMAEGKK